MLLKGIQELREKTPETKDEFLKVLESFANKYEIRFMKTIDFDELIIDDRAIYSCQFGCKNYNRKYSCPPKSFSSRDFRKKGLKWDKVFLFTISQTLDDFWNKKHNRRLEKFSFYHKKILARLTENYMRKVLFQIEELFKSWNYKIFGLAGGSCQSCKICGLIQGTSCKKPSKMRMSLESVGVDVEKTFSYNGYNIEMPNYGSSVRAAGLLIRGDIPKIDFCPQPSPQSFRQPEEIRLNYLKNEKKIEFIKILDVSDIEIQDKKICSNSCPGYNNNYSCPPFVTNINPHLWDKAILWKWKENSYKKHSYSKTLEFVHKAVFYKNHYFALPLRHCRCDFCDSCSYNEKLNNETDLRLPCKRYKVLAPAMETFNINMSQFGEGIFGIELI